LPWSPSRCHCSTSGEPTQRDELLKTIAQRETTRYFQGIYLEEVLGAGREKISNDLRDRIQASYDKLNPGTDGVARGAGVKVVYVGVAGVHPPKDTAPAFETPVQADQKRLGNLLNAEANRVQTLTKVVGDYNLAGRIVDEIDVLNALSEKRRAEGATSTVTEAQVAQQELVVAEMIGKAGGNAASMLAKASAERWQKHMSSRGLSLRYGGQLAIFKAAPMVFLSRQYFDAMQEMTDGSRMFVVGGGQGSMRWQVDATDKDLGTDAFKPKQE
jgi:modulator of FtsH protease HflK